MLKPVLCCLCLCLACQEDVQLHPGVDVLEITVDPPAVTIDAPSQVDFTARGRFRDGTVHDVTGEVVWRVDDSAAGDFSTPGRYLASGRAGGHITASATAPRTGATGTAAITVVLTRTRIDPAFPPSPAGVDLLDSGAPVVLDDPLRSPAIAYPPAGALFPRDMAPPLFQWTTGEGNDVFVLRFESDVLNLRVYTTADRWRPDDETWRWIADSNAGQSVAFSIIGAQVASPSALYGITPIELGASRRSAEGTIYFWSSSRQGIVASSVSATSATPYYAVPPDDTCVSCHAVSRDGARMAVGWNGETLQAIDLPGRTVRLAADRQRGMGFATYSPDGSRLLVADRGVLRLLDASTGAPVRSADGVVSLPSGMQATHPDWSPLGDSVAVALGSMITNRDMRGGRIARLPFAGDQFGAPEVLVDSAGDADNNYFPRYTPDGGWLVYVHADSSSRDAVTAELRLVSVAGGTPIVLSAANGPPSSGSALPSVAPSADGSLAWVTFSTIRPYALVRPLDGDDQIWITALDLEKAAAGLDPSRPALWLPGQDLTEMNHLPVWATKPPED